ncbi:MAG: flagellar export protein FliJ [Bacillota bacterium]
MSRFIFKYQNLLQIKERYEEVAQANLSKVLQRLEKEKHNLNEMYENKEELQQVLHRKLQDGTDISMVKNYDYYIVNLNKRIDQQIMLINQITQEVSRARAELMKAAKEKKTFEKLKENDKVNFDYLENRSEQNFVDQLVTFKNYKNN